MRTATKLLTPQKTNRKPSTWDKAAGLLKSKKVIVLRELAQGRKTWSTKHK